MDMKDPLFYRVFLFLLEITIKTMDYLKTFLSGKWLFMRAYGHIGVEGFTLKEYNGCKRVLGIVTKHNIK